MKTRKTEDKWENARSIGARFAVQSEIEKILLVYARQFYFGE